MSCRHAEPWIADYLAGTLYPDATRELQRHLAECADCRLRNDCEMPLDKI